MTDAATVRDVAALARLAISDQDIENATAEFNQTLALFDALSSADTTNVAPMINPLDSAQRLRTDRIETLVDRAGFDAKRTGQRRGLLSGPESTRLMAVPFETISSLAKQLDAGHVSSRELVEDAIARTERLNQNLTPLLLWISPALWRRQKKPTRLERLAQPHRYSVCPCSTKTFSAHAACKHRALQKCSQTLYHPTMLPL